MADGIVLIVGGTEGIGRQLASHYLERGREVVITGRDEAKCEAIASDLGDRAGGIGFDLSKPETIAGALADVGPVDKLVLCAIARDNNPVREYDVASAVSLSTMKLVGYTEVIHTLLDRLSADSSVVLFGGRAKDRPYPGSTTVTGIVGDSPFWENKPLDAVVDRTPTGRLATMEDVVDATVFLLENRSVNGVNLYVDSGWLLT
jgi:NAD(P)-dependent dehydrogenase (short-subunit alcohol dehydrogenase family)